MALTIVLSKGLSFSCPHEWNTFFPLCIPALDTLLFYKPQFCIPTQFLTPYRVSISLIAIHLGCILDLVLKPISSLTPLFPNVYKLTRLEMYSHKMSTTLRSLHLFFLPNFLYLFFYQLILRPLTLASQLIRLIFSA